MKFLNNSKFVLLKNIVPIVRKTNYRQYAATINRDWIDLEAICKTGNIPTTFNFARDVFEKHVVSFVEQTSLLDDINRKKFNFKVERPTATALWLDNDKTENKFSFSDLKTESIRAAIALRNVLDLKSHSHHDSPYILVILPRVPGSFCDNI